MWDTRYRPAVFADVLGQGGSTKILQARLRENRAFDTSYIFAGGHGCGKTTLARILSRAMLCLQPTQEGDPCNQCDHCKACLSESFSGFTEMDAASQGTTADMRRLVDGLVYDIPGVPKRIYLLDEAHRMSRDAQDVLLKPVEDKRVVVIFCTTELAKIRDTIKSRCEVYEIRKIQREDILERMKWVLGQEGVDFEEDAVLSVIDLAGGHVRDILNKLETVAQLGPVTMDAVRERLNLSVVSTYYQILLSLSEPSRAVALLEEACDRVGPTDVAAGLAEAAMNAYRQANNIHSDVTPFDKDLATQVYSAFGKHTTSLAEHFLRASGFTTRLHLTCDLLRLCDTQGVPPVAQVQAPPVPVVVQVASLAPTPTQTAQTPEPVKVPLPAVKALPGTAAPLKPPPADPTKQKFVRPDGVGPKGSSDLFALTSLDHHAVSQQLPRDHRQNQTQVHRVKHKPAEEQITTSQVFTTRLRNLLDSNG